MASDLTVQTIRGPGSGANANKILIPAGQTLDTSAASFVPATDQIVQVKTTNSKVFNTISTGNAWVEVHNSYRVSITPKYANSMIVLNYWIPINPQNASNTLMLIAATKSTDSGSTFSRTSLSSSGTSLGSRFPISGGAFRRGNGYDNNDMNIESISAVDFPNTTNPLVYGFHFLQESSGAAGVLFNHTQSDNNSWGWTSSITITAMEIKQ
jgi:hypothetical protein